MNNMQFIIHGVPSGHQVWGTDQKHYFEGFYGSYDQYVKAHSVLVVETRKNGKDFVSYYTFIRSQNVTAHDGRTGSYFGMTVSVDNQYCTDVNSLYHLLDQVFSQKMTGKIFTKTGESEKYLVEDFASVSQYLCEVSNIVMTQIENHLSGEFEETDNTFTKKEASKSVYYNLEDIDSETFINATKVYGKVYVSHEYPTKDALIESLKSGNKKNSDQQKELEATISKMSSENTSLTNTIESLKGQLSSEKQKGKSLSEKNVSLQKERDTLMEEKKQLAERISELKKAEDLDKIAAKLEPSLSELLGILRQRNSEVAIDRESCSKKINPHTTGDKKKVTTMRKLLINILVGLVLLLGGATLSAWRSNRNDENLKSELGSVKSQLETMTEKYKSAMTELESLKAISNRTAESDDQQVQVSSSVPAARIDVKNFPGGAMTSGGTYTIQILHCSELGEWEVDGANTSSNLNSREIVITTLNPGKITLRYVVNNEAIANRTIEVM